MDADTSFPASKPSPRRFYLASDGRPWLPDTLVELDATQSRHAAGVLRLSEGGEVELFDGKGCWARAAITKPSPKRTVCHIIESGHVDPSPTQLVVAAAFPKGARADTMVEQLAQLGATRLIPLLSARTVVKPRSTKLERFAAASIESAKQSGRFHAMGVKEPMQFDEAIGLDAAARFIADPHGETQATWFGDKALPRSNCLVLVGPEGGFTPKEIKAATQAGFVPWRLAEHVLRVETAAVAATSVLAWALQQQSNKASD